MKESDKKKIGEAYLRLHSCNEEEGMTNEKAIKIIKQFRDRQGNSRDDNEAFDKAIKVLETHERLTEMLYKKMTAYAEMEKSRHLNDLEYGNKIAYAHCLEVLNDDE